MIFNYKGSFWKSFPLYLLILLIFIPFALTFSRGGYVAMLASMIVIACFKGHRIIFLPIAVFLLMMKFVLPPEIMDRILTIGSIVTPGSDVRVEAWDDRLGMWTRALYRWQKRPLLGMGPGSFDLGGVDNQYFMELATVGTIGLAIFLLIIGLILFITVRVFMQTKDPFIRNVSIGFFAGTIGYIVNGMSMSTFILIRTMQPFYVHVGLLCFVYRALVLERSGDAESGEKALSPPDFAQ
ncbi:MAG TPA: O-antigen ligase family protein, partial [bacterium]|nr:O-antigen ligase family protein [bacterium]